MFTLFSLDLFVATIMNASVLWRLQLACIKYVVNILSFFSFSNIATTGSNKTLLYLIVLQCIILYCVVLCYLVLLYCIALHCIALHCIALHCIVLYCIVLYCIVLYCIVLYCTVLYCIVQLQSVESEAEYKTRIFRPGTSTNIQRYCTFFETGLWIFVL